MNKLYRESIYRSRVAVGVDEIEVLKPCNSEWMDISMTTNDRPGGGFTIRSREQAEILRFMLGQALGIGNQDAD